MDTYMQVKAYGPSSKNLPELAQQEIQRLDNLLSAHNKGSELSRLQSGQPVKVSPDTAFLLDQAFKINQETQGAFDITLGPVSRLWGFPHGPYKIPSDQELKATLANTGMSKLRWKTAEQTCTLSSASVSIDLGGIAKGYAADKAAAKLQQAGCTSALLNLGGNVKVLGSKPDGSPWSIAIQHPDSKEKHLGVLRVTDTSIVTSGDYERYFEAQGIRYHHILDPQTGLPANKGLRSVTIVCQDSTLADGLSTALFVLGPKRAIDYWQRHQDSFQMLLFDRNGKLTITPQLAKQFQSDYPFTIIQ